MTPKQQFLETFLKHVFGFDTIEIYNSYSGCTFAKGIAFFELITPPQYCLASSETVVETAKIDIWVDKNKTTGYTIKFKTVPIPESKFGDVKARAEYLCPGAVVDIYNRSHAYSQTADIPTLRLRVSELPWK